MITTPTPSNTVADFSRLSKTYTPYPDALSHHIFLKDFANDKLRQRLRKVSGDS